MDRLSPAKRAEKYIVDDMKDLNNNKFPLRLYKLPSDD
jgi:hypothetical protein